MALPPITADEYRNYIDECLVGNINQEWKDLLNERKSYAGTLKYIVVYDNNYVMMYNTRYIVKIVSNEIFTALGMTNDMSLKKRGVIHYLLQKQTWFEELPIDEKEAYKMISYGIQNVHTNPYVDYFCVRFKVALFRFFKISHILPAGFNPTYVNSESVIVCYGTGVEPASFNTQFSVYLKTLVRLLDSNVSEENVVDILCTQLTNEIVALNNANGKMQIDMHLVKRVQILFADKPFMVGEVVNRYLKKIRQIPGGLELVGYTSSMLRQIIPNCEITVLTEQEEYMFSGSVTQDP
jgi:hypothetical protein